MTNRSVNALILDDSIGKDVLSISWSLRYFAQAAVHQYTLIENFVGDCQRRGISLSKALSELDIVVCDDNFNSPLSFTQRKRGYYFLLHDLKDALSHLQPGEKRPLVICYSPSGTISTKDIQRLWQEENIAYFQKINEGPFIGLLARTALHLQRPISRETLLTQIFGFSPCLEVANPQLLDLYDNTTVYLETIFAKEERVIEGPGKDLSWECFLARLREILPNDPSLTRETLGLRIESLRQQTGIERLKG